MKSYELKKRIQPVMTALADSGFDLSPLDRSVLFSASRTAQSHPNFIDYDNRN